MTKADWIAIAQALAELHEPLEKRRDHDSKVRRNMLHRVSVHVCEVLAQRSSRFNKREFARVARINLLR